MRPSPYAFDGERADPTVKEALVRLRAVCVELDGAACRAFYLDAYETPEVHL